MEGVHAIEELQVERCGLLTIDLWLERIARCGHDWRNGTQSDKQYKNLSVSVERASSLIQIVRLRAGDVGG